MIGPVVVLALVVVISVGLVARAEARRRRLGRDAHVQADQRLHDINRAFRAGLRAWRAVEPLGEDARVSYDPRANAIRLHARNGFRLEDAEEYEAYNSMRDQGIRAAFEWGLLAATMAEEAPELVPSFSISQGRVLWMPKATHATATGSPTADEHDVAPDVSPPVGGAGRWRNDGHGPPILWPLTQYERDALFEDTTQPRPAPGRWIIRRVMFERSERRWERMKQDLERARTRRLASSGAIASPRRPS